ncbi:sensor histidine kinase [Bacillus mycoides]|uniref:sensor histidine kinase n=1 Tax=Bacillus mycoides TaxID=1405 RepID=UPI0010407387|nr:sensor histidine kinase [Bacillus mycoides]MBJ7995898.1 sensor histidine kinase [Bacillus cereus]MED1401342.1 sensor histidine kinase [Bacillus mycoides]QWH83316.1 HAMP domain-containing histidine kinase [Bacillus mycoides]QWI94888.1 sensor histidine kinase [Bacillus mycoides]TBX54578.1 HAMP domain-containing histidine kinase [Bacillus mycoides]
MSFFQYIKDKRFFFGLYFLLMLFVTLMLILNDNQNLAIRNILYTHILCFFLVSLYIIIGYYYRRSFYIELNDLIESNKDEFLAAIPEPQNYEQALYVQMIKKVNDNHSKHLQQLIHEKIDHQDFIMSWIHEVKLPIAASSLLMENSTGKTVDFLVDKLEDELSKIDNYVEQALYYSRIDSFSRDYFITDIELEKVVKKSIKKYAKTFITKQIHFHMDDIQQFIQSDSKWLAFIIDQVIANALKYGNENGTISFFFEEDSGEKRLLIHDTGIGIKQEDLHRVFERGFTGSTGRIHTKSTGMGLYLAKQMALKLGHNLSIQSQEEVYTQVTIHFPKIRTYNQFHLD